MNSFLRDLAYSARMLRKAPAVTIVMVVALALGLAVNASAFLFAYSLVVRPLPFHDLGSLVTIWESPLNINAERGLVAPANFLDFQEQSRSFEHLAAYRGWDVNLTGVDDPERLLAFHVSGDYFDVLGMHPERGRAFLREEVEGTGAHVAVVSNGFWKRRLASASDAVGRSVSLNGEAYTIVGIMPADFNFPLETEVWAPLAFTEAERHDRTSHELAVLGRVKPGVSVQQARAELSGIARRLASAHPGTNENRDARVVPILEMINQVTDRFCMILLATTGFVLLLACANVGNLLLVRLAGRQRELAVRTALGATGKRIASHLIAESLIVSALAGVVGIVLASWNLSFGETQIPPVVARYVAGIRNLHMNGMVAAYIIAASLVTGLLCAMPGVVQALRTARGMDAMEGLKEAGRGGSLGPSRARLRSVLAVFEVVLALVLMIGAGVMVRTFNRLLAVNPGFNIQRLLTFHVSLPPNKYSGDAPARTFYETLRTDLETVPSARSAAISSGIGDADGIWIEGRPDPRPGEPRPSIVSVSPEYFRTMEIPVRSGRPLSARDGRDAPPVVVISDSVARHYWPGVDPVGARIRLRNGGGPWLTVVGVSGDLRDWFFGTAQPAAYVSFLQAPQVSAGVFVRTSGDPMSIASAVRAEVRKLDRGQPIFDLQSEEQLVAEQTSGVRMAAVSMSIYAGIALLLAATGIYAIISYSVQQRTHEIGVRMALGAGRGSILGMALSGALRIGGLGFAVGIPAALALIKGMSSALYGVVKLDWLTFAGGVIVLGLAAVAAGYVPALRAARVDPLQALREE
jgi:putative ABC transport system permease protein